MRFVCAVMYCVVICCVIASAGVARAGVKVTPNKENIVASRIEGKWAAAAALTERLTGNRPDRESPQGEVEFTVDPSVAEKLPAKYDLFLEKKTIYLAGTMKIKGSEHPFILIGLNGNPHVVWFRQRNGDPMGDAESFNVMLAAARDRSKDLLFIGGDFANSPFRALQREPAE